MEFATPTRRPATAGQPGVRDGSQFIEAISPLLPVRCVLLSFVCATLFHRCEVTPPRLIFTFDLLKNLNHRAMHLRSTAYRGPILCLLLPLLLVRYLAVASTEDHVILLTIDGFAAYYLNDPKAPVPTLRRLAAEGAVAEAMEPSNPAITWPNHTTLVTGVGPDRHSVLFNGVLSRPGPGRAVAVDGNKTKEELVAVPTLYDYLHGRGYRTADVNWPCTRGAITLDDSFPDVPHAVSHMTPRLREELIRSRWLSGTNDDAFTEQSSAYHDQVWTAAATHLIRERRPNLMLFHLLITDSTQHKYGPQSPAAYTALALADAHVAELLRAIDAAGIRNRTTLVVTADHGFHTALKLIHPNVALRKAGLLESTATPTLLKARAQIISEGGTALLYFTDPSTRTKDRAQALEVMEQLEGIAEMITPDRYKAFGYPDPTSHAGMAEVVLVAKEGYAFTNEARGDDEVTAVTLAAGNQGHHGLLASHPRMKASFIAWGHGIRSGTKLGIIRNIDVAPTVAALLGESLPNAEGRVLTEMFSPSMTSPSKR